MGSGCCIFCLSLFNTHCSILIIGLRHCLPATSINDVYLFVPHIFMQNYYDWSWNHRERNKLTHCVYFTHECRSRNIEFRAISIRVVRERDSAKKYVWKLYDFHCPLTSFRQHQNKTLLGVLFFLLIGYNVVFPREN